MTADPEQSLQASQPGAFPSFLEWLTARQTLTPVLGERVAKVQAETSDRICGILLKLGLLSETDLADGLRSYTGLASLTPADIPSKPVPIEDLNVSFLRGHEIVPLRLSDRTLDVALWDALDDYAPAALEFACKRTVRRAVGTRTEVQHLGLRSWKLWR